MWENVNDVQSFPVSNMNVDFIDKNKFKFQAQAQVQRKFGYQT